MSVLENPYLLALASATSGGVIAYVLRRLFGHRLAFMFLPPGRDGRGTGFMMHLQNLEEHPAPVPIVIRLQLAGDGEFTDLSLLAGPGVGASVKTSAPLTGASAGPRVAEVTISAPLRGYCVWTLVGRLSAFVDCMASVHAPDSVLVYDRLDDQHSDKTPWQAPPPLGFLTVPSLLAASIVFYFATTRMLLGLLAIRVQASPLEDGVISGGIVLTTLLAHSFARARSPTPIVQGYFENRVRLITAEAPDETHE